MAAHKTIHFSGYEIDRIIAFLTLVKSGKRADISEIVCEGVASILTQQDARPARRVFRSEAQSDTTGYQRTLRFSSDKQTSEYGGANAIREEWRLRKVTIHYKLRRNAVPLATAQSWLHALFPSDGESSLSDQEHGAVLADLRAALMNVPACSQPDVLKVNLKQALRGYLKSAGELLSSRDFYAVGAVLADLSSQEFANELLLLLHRAGSPEQLAGSSILRQLFLDAKLAGSGRLREFAGRVLHHAVDRLASLTHQPGRTLGVQDARRTLTTCWNIVEAVSFAEIVDAEVADLLVQILRLLTSLDRQELAPALREEVASALSAALVCYGALFQRLRRAGAANPFEGSVAEVRQSAAQLMRRGGMLPIDATQRIAAMSCVAMITSPEPGAVQQAFSGILQSLREAGDRTEQEKLDRDAEIAAAADACGLLFALAPDHWPRLGKRGQSDAMRALTLLGDHWDRTASLTVRRACARSIFEALRNSLSMAPLIRTIRKWDSSAPRESLRHHRHHSHETLEVDLPTHALLLALDDWKLLERLAPSQQYRDNPSPLALSAALLAFTDGERLASQSQFNAAVVAFAEAASHVRTVRDDLMADDVRERLAEGIEARALCCPLVGRIASPEHELLAAAKAYGDLAQGWEVTDAAIRDPDFHLARAFQQLLSAAAGSRYWAEHAAWAPELTHQFSAAIKSAQQSGSVELRAFIREHVTELGDRQTALMALGKSEDLGEAPELPNFDMFGPLIKIGSKAIALTSMLAATLRRQARFDKIRPMLLALPSCRLRPVGMIGAGASVQW